MITLIQQQKQIILDKFENFTSLKFVLYSRFSLSIRDISIEQYKFLLAVNKK